MSTLDKDISSQGHGLQENEQIVSPPKDHHGFVARHVHLSYARMTKQISAFWISELHMPIDSKIRRHFCQVS